MTEIVPLDFEGAAVRVLTVDGEPWWVAADVASILGLGNPRTSLALLDDDEKGVHSMDTPGGPQQVTAVNEPGLYSLILRSRKPQAKAFKKWITREVIPSIRKTGGYGAREMTKLEALRAAIESEEARLVAESRAEVAERQVRELEPMAAAGRTFTEIKGTVSVAVAAGHLSNDLNITVGRTRLFTKMREMRWICREGRGDKKHWRAMQPALEARYLVEVPNPYIDPDTGDREFGTPTIRVTSGGLKRLYLSYYEEGQGRIWEDAG